MKWSVGSLMFFLPGLVGFIGDFLERLPAINSVESSRLVSFVFGASVLLAAVVPAVFIMTAPTALARRLGFTAAVWCLLFLEVFIVFLWSLRGIR
jgi:CBS domain containing-hemolysin-like protein